MRVQGSEKGVDGRKKRRSRKRSEYKDRNRGLRQDKERKDEA